ncbi:DUF7283 family protein [Halopiger thermotolerans]
MDFETPADAWYTYVAVSIVSVALAGLAVGIAPGPTPDADRAADAIEAATGSEYAASATYEHDADRTTINRQTITMANEHGTAHATFAYGAVVPVNGHERLENLTDGRSFDNEYDAALEDPQTDAAAEFFADVAAAEADNAGESLRTDGELVARTVAVEADDAVGIQARTTDATDFEADLADESDALDADDVAVPKELRLRTTGDRDEPLERVAVDVEGRELVETVDLEDSEGWFRDGVTSLTCSGLGVWCDDPPDVTTEASADVRFESFDAGGETIRFVESDLEDVADSDADEVTVWAGTYDLEVSVSGPEFDDCRADIERTGEWVTICGPETTLEAFDDPYWHETRDGVHYVTLVSV